MTRNSTDNCVYKLSRHSVPNPAAGALDLQFALPVNSFITLAHFTAKYVADANVADRLITVGRQTGLIFYPLSSSAYSITAGQTWELIASMAVLPNTATSSGYLYLPLPDMPFFNQGEWMFWKFENAQATDQFSDLNIWLKEWVYES